MKRAATVGLLALVGASNAASAAILVQDNFESYPAQPAPNATFDAAWPIQTAATAPTGGTAITSFITAGPGTNTSKVVSFPANGAGNVGRREQAFTNTVPTATDAISFSFDFYDAAPTASYRQYAEIYSLNENSANALTQLIAVGENNSATAGIPTPGGTAATYSTTKYKARVAFGTGGGWFNLKTTRTQGWHNFRVVITGTQIDFLVDGVYDTSFTNGGATTGVAEGFDRVRFSSGLSSANGGAFFDNFLVQTVVPEPTSALAMVAGGSMLLRRRR